MGLFGHKEGISPLIATILLIAFAVALGAMIMNWGANILVSPSTSDCDDVLFTTQSHLGDEPFCYDNVQHAIFFRLRNNGQEPIENVKLITITSTDSSEQDLPSTRIEDGGVLQKTVPYTKQGPFRAELIPVINDGGRMTACVASAVVVENLPDC